MAEVARRVEGIPRTKAQSASTIEKFKIGERLRAIGFPYLRREHLKGYVDLIAKLRPLMTTVERTLYQRGLKGAKPGHFAAMKWEGGDLDYIGLGRLSIGVLRLWPLLKEGNVEEELTGIKPQLDRSRGVFRRRDG